MRFNPIKRILYTDKGEMIRKLSCPFKVTVDEIAPEPPSGDHICDICLGEIIDTEGFDDESLLQLSQRSNVCFKVDATQPNIRIIYV